MMMWSSREDLNKKILLDCDVLRHFIKGQSTNKLSSIFPGQLFILDIVESEICRSKSIEPIITSLIDNNHIQRMNFPTGTRFINEYSSLYLKYGQGESACMAVARHTTDIIGSNNLTDIEEYCRNNNILFLTTMDFLYVANEKGVMTESEVDYFLYLNLSCAIPSKIPYNTLESFINTNPQIMSVFQMSA